MSFPRHRAEQRCRWIVMCLLLAGLRSWLPFRSEGFAGEKQNESKTHWAFQPLKAASVPGVENIHWIKTPIDHFILEKLEANGLRPGAVADKRTFIRRATFDLLGLPPQPEEVEAFLADESSNARARLIDRLLDSPHYGERWGRHWLDVARYADNKGYVFFEEKNYPWAWTYRDYVVRAFNEDKPFDQFVTEQLAADLLDKEEGGGKGERGDRRIEVGGERPEAALAALGFLTVGDHFSNNTHDILDDRIDVVCRGLLGLTVGCARCHDHKFDPITMADYYGLYGVFRSCREPMAPPILQGLPPKEESEQFELDLAGRERELSDFVESKHREIVEGARSRISEYLMAVYAQRNQPPTENFMVIADKGDLNPAVIARWRAYLEKGGTTNRLWMPWAEFSKLEETKFADLAPAAHEMLRAATNLNAIVARKFSDLSPRSMKDVADAYAELLGGVDKHWRQALAKAPQDSVPSPKTLPEADEEELRRVLYGPDAPPDVPAQMDWGFLSLLPDRASQGEFQKLLKAMEECLMRPNAPARAMVLEDAAEPYEPRIFQRGNPNRPGQPVTRRFLQALDGSCRPFSQGSGRLELARAIVDRNNPMTARVFVNRVWMHHFGAGLVNTPSDFGRRSDPPSHPELLDWLAGEFVRSGWRIKELHRLIMNSAVYQQASVTGALEEDVHGKGSGQSLLTPAPAGDVENRLLSHMNRIRHEYETQRDALLAVSGKLEDRLGGPPVSAVTPRRTIYTFVDRLDLPPVMATFDFPSPSASCPKRAQTTVAPQALFLMNNEFVAECAANLMRRGDVAGVMETKHRVDRIYALLFSRPPSASDLEHAERFLGGAPSEKDWQDYGQALLMSNEFVFVD